MPQREQSRPGYHQIHPLQHTVGIVPHPWSQLVKDSRANLPGYWRGIGTERGHSHPTNNHTPRRDIQPEGKPDIYYLDDASNTLSTSGEEAVHNYHMRKDLTKGMA